MSAAFLCAYCKGPVHGAAYITHENEVLHDGHAAVYKRMKHGLIYECPVCKTHGKVRDMGRPERRTREEPDPNAWGSGNGMMSVDYTEYPHEKTCGLCGGDGYLDKPAVPVVETRTVGYRRD